jgi:hypothetical protein
VEIIPTATVRTADFLIDGVKYELKTLSNVVNQTSNGLSASYHIESWKPAGNLETSSSMREVKQA